MEGSNNLQFCQSTTEVDHRQFIKLEINWQLVSIRSLNMGNATNILRFDIFLLITRKSIFYNEICFKELCWLSLFAQSSTLFFSNVFNVRNIAIPLGGADVLCIVLQCYCSCICHLNGSRRRCFPALEKCINDIPVIISYYILIEFKQSLLSVVCRLIKKCCSF